jgi:hypothetical protein
MMEITFLELLYSMFCVSKWQCMWYYVMHNQNSHVMEIYKHHVIHTNKNSLMLNY